MPHASRSFLEVDESGRTTIVFVLVSSEAFALIGKPFLG